MDYPVFPLVSVCMTTYNHEAYLAQAIESVLAQQTSFGVELVLGDDCSTDSTAAICREYAEKYPGRVRFVTGQRNVGLACQLPPHVRGLPREIRGLLRRRRLVERPPQVADAGRPAGVRPLVRDVLYARQQLLPEHRPHRTRPRGAFYRFRPPALSAHHRQLRHAGAPRPHRPLLCRGAPREHPEWLTDDAPMWLWFAACSRIRYLPVITAVHRRLPQSVSHSTEYPRRIAFCDSLMDISLWFDARYGARRNRFRHPAAAQFGRVVGTLLERFRRRIPRPVAPRRGCLSAPAVLPRRLRAPREEDFVPT